MDAPFLVTGAGRCGTHYLSAVLNELGVATGHEAVFGFDEQAAGAWGGLAGECSWPAAAYVHRFPVGLRILHLVRDPLACARSRHADRQLRDREPRTTVGGFVRRHRPDVFDDATDELGRVLLFVARWNRAVEGLAPLVRGATYRRAAVEVLSHDPDELARTVAFLSGTDPGVERAAEVQAALDPATGSTRRSPRASFTWADVTAHPNGAELVSLAADYGYGDRGSVGMRGDGREAGAALRLSAG